MKAERSAFRAQKNSPFERIPKARVDGGEIHLKEPRMLLRDLHEFPQTLLRVDVDIVFREATFMPVDDEQHARRVLAPVDEIWIRVGNHFPDLAELKSSAEETTQLDQDSSLDRGGSVKPSPTPGAP